MNPKQKQDLADQVAAFIPDYETEVRVSRPDGSSYLTTNVKLAAEYIADFILARDAQHEVETFEQLRAMKQSGSWCCHPDDDSWHHIAPKGDRLSDCDVHDAGGSTGDASYNQAIDDVLAQLSSNKKEKD